MSKIDTDSQVLELAESLREEIKALPPRVKQLTDQALQLLLPDVKQALSQGVPQKSIIAMLRQRDIKISAAKFKRIFKGASPSKMAGPNNEVAS